MIKKILIYATTLTVLLTTGAHLALADTRTESANKAADYLLSQRESSGSIGGVSYSGWALQGLTAAGKTSPQTLAYLENNLGDIETMAATDIERTILAVLAGGRDPHNFGGKDLIAILKTKVVDNQLGGTGLTNDDIFGIIALLASGEPVTDPIVTSSIQFLINTQKSNGSFSWSTNDDGDSNDTAAAIQALRYAQRKGYTGNTGISRARAYLVSTQNNDGGFAYQSGFDSDATTTAWVVMALNALNESPENWVKNGNQPMSYLQSLQLENGAVEWQAGNGADIYTTTFAAIAFAGDALPVSVLAVEPSPSPTPSVSLSPSPSPLVTATPTPVVTPSVTPSATPSASPSAAPTQNATPTPTPATTTSPSVSPSPQPSTSPSSSPVAVLTVTSTQTETPSAINAIKGKIAAITSSISGTRTSPTSEPTSETGSELTTTEAAEEETVTPSPDATYLPTPAIKGEEKVNGTASTIAAVLLILIGLLLIAWGTVTYVKFRTRRPE